MIAKLKSTNQCLNLLNEKKVIILPGKEILVEVDGVIEYATYLAKNNCLNIESENANFVRILTSEDEKVKIENKKVAENYVEDASQKIFRHGLDMKILNADLSFDKKKLTFYFSAQGRVDFRGLVSDMAGDFKKIIRLQQLGPREEAKNMGGIGKCGRKLCCSEFMDNLAYFPSDNNENKDLKYAKSPAYLGSCGKQMCCLAFEDNYQIDLKKKEKEEK